MTDRTANPARAASWLTALTGAALALVGCGDTGMASTNMIEPAAIERFVGHALPSGATAIRTHAESGVDTLTLLRFDAPVREAEAFAERVLGGPAEEGADPLIAPFGEGIGWWTPVFTPESRGGRADDAARNRSVRVAVVPGAAGIATVWLVAFSR
jgi:hypothetical protein